MEREFEPRQFGSGTYMLKSPLMIIMIKTNIDCMFSITICQTPWWVFYKYSVLYSQPYYMVSGVPTEQMEKWGKWCWVTQVSCCPDPSISSTEPMFLTQQKGHGKIETNNHGTQTWGSMEEAESRSQGWCWLWHRFDSKLSVWWLSRLCRKRRMWNKELKDCWEINGLASSSWI